MTKWYNQTTDEALSALGADAQNGLDGAAAGERLQEHGLNELQEGRKEKKAKENK